MRVFIGGVMQASITGKGIVSQDYRREIAGILQARWPEVVVIDPFQLHPTSVEYNAADARTTLFAMLDLAAGSDLVIAYVPVASMGTALEMYSAYQRGVPVLTISPLSENWVVKSVSRRVFADLASFSAYVADAESADALQQFQM